MATKEMQLISRIIRTGDLNSIIEWGITPEDFLTNEGRAMFNHILGYYSRPGTSGSVIGEQIARQLYPTFIFCDDMGMTVPALCEEVRKDRLAADINVSSSQVLELTAHDPLAAANMMQAAASSILSVGLKRDTDVAFTTAANSIMRRYEMKKAGIDLSVCSWPFSPLQYATGGIEMEDYVVLYGRPKSMKSWVLAVLIAWAFEKGMRALIYTKEMTAENIFMRVMAVLSCIRYQEFRMGQLDPYEEYALYSTQRMIEILQHTQQFICLSGKDAPEGGDTVPWLRSKVKQYKPNIAFIDGLYLMSDAKRAKKDNVRVMNISRACRDLTLHDHIPLIATLQATRAAAQHGRAELDEIAYSDALSQDCTLAMRVINDKEDPTISLVVGGSREFKLDGFRIYGIPATNFSDHSVLTMSDILKAQDNDKGDEPKKKKKSNAEKAVDSAVVDTRGMMANQLRQ